MTYDCYNDGDVIHLIGTLSFQSMVRSSRRAVSVWYTLFNITYKLSSTGFISVFLHLVPFYISVQQANIASI